MSRRRYTSKEIAEFTLIWFWVNVAIWEAGKWICRTVLRLCWTW